jgi:hypothetical protein
MNEHLTSDSVTPESLSETQAGHTPGPWHVRTLDGSIGTVDANDITVAQAQEVSAADRNAGHSVRIANTRLIAAAPDLLEALTKIAAIEDLMYGGDWDEIEQARQIARAAISKATT